MTQFNTPEPPALDGREPDSADDLTWDMAMSAKLPPGQRKAIFSLLYGNTPQAAADSAGVHRSTLYRWMRDDPAFKSAMAECRVTLCADAREQVASLIGECVELVHGAVIGGDVQMAYRVLRATGVLDRQAFAARQQEAEESAARSADVSRDPPDALARQATKADLSHDAKSPQEPRKA